MKTKRHTTKRPIQKRERYWQKDTEKAYYHLIVKTFENTPGNFTFAFSDSHKKKLEDMLWRLDTIYLVDVVSYCIMSNHVHIILVRDNKADVNMSLKEAAIRYQNYYKLAEPPNPRSFEVKNFRKRINSISEFMRDFQRQFTWWYNHRDVVGREGSLWANAFKSVVLKSKKALVECMKYVELNPLRAKMVNNISEYRYSSWGHIVRNDEIGRKLRGRIIENLSYMMGEAAEQQSDKKIFLSYAGDLEALAVEVGQNKDIKRIDPYNQEFLLSKCEHWNKLKIISGEDVLTGIGKGHRKPKIINFTPKPQE
jgi:REP element-mobilizing transposase RayT